MVERVKPQGTVTGRIDTDGYHIEEIDSDQPHRRQRGDVNDGFGKPVVIIPFGGCELSYRIKTTQGGEHRRYYIGFIQFAFVRKDPDGFIVHLTGQDDAPIGRRLLDEAAVERYLRSQLVVA